MTSLSQNNAAAQSFTSADHAALSKNLDRTCYQPANERVIKEPSFINKEVDFDLSTNGAVEALGALSFEGSTGDNLILLAPNGEETPPPPAEDEQTSKYNTTIFQISGNPVSLCMGQMFEVLRNLMECNKLMYTQSSNAVTASSAAALNSRDRSYDQADAQYNVDMTESTMSYVNAGVTGATTVAPFASDNIGQFKTDKEIAGQVEAPTSSWSQFFGRQGERVQNAITKPTSDSSYMAQGERESHEARANLKTVHEMDSKKTDTGTREFPPARITGEKTGIKEHTAAVDGAGDAAPVGAPAPATTSKPTQDQLDLINHGKLSAEETDPAYAANPRSYEARLKAAYGDMTEADRTTSKIQMEKVQLEATQRQNTYSSNMTRRQGMFQAVNQMVTSGVTGWGKGQEAIFNRDATEAGANAKIYDNVQGNLSGLADANRSLASKNFDEAVSALQQIQAARQNYKVY